MRRNSSAIEPVPWPMIGADAMIDKDALRKVMCSPIDADSLV